jgi:hypothetical protein
MFGYLAAFGISVETLFSPLKTPKIFYTDSKYSGQLSAPFFFL